MLWKYWSLFWTNWLHLLLLLTIQQNKREDNISILRLPILKDIACGISKILETELLVSPNTPFCNVCSSHIDSDSELTISSLGRCLIIQLNRFIITDGVAVKNSAPVICKSEIELVTKLEQEVSFTRRFKLSGLINHSGTLERGHYTCIVRDGDIWWHCNDRAMVQTSLQNIDLTLPYILFYTAV